MSLSSCPCGKTISRLTCWFVLLIISTCVSPYRSWAETDQSTAAVKQAVAEADEFLEQFQFRDGLTLLQGALQQHPNSPLLHKKCGDVLMILGQNQDARVSYRQALTLDPDWVEGHWALWALLNRLSMDQNLELDSLLQIAALDAHNPLAQIRVTRKLREQGRFEESVEYFRRAVEKKPTHLAYRLFLARALFDIRNTDAAQQKVQWVLSHASPGSPVRIAAQNLLHTVQGGTVYMGSRTGFFETTKQPYGEEGKNYKRWALTREHAWQFMKTRNFAEAETTWRTVLTLDLEDDLAHYNLGLTLLALEKYEDAIASLQDSFLSSKQPPFYPDAIFHIGKAFAKLELWEKAIVYYQQVFDIQDLKEQDFYALNFPDLTKVQIALQEARTHISTLSESPIVGLTTPSPPKPQISLEEKRLPIPPPDSSQNLSPKSQTPLRVLHLSVNIVQGWFRQLIMAKAIGEDDLQAGFHEYIPLDPGDTFPPDQPRIYPVFAVTTPPADTRQITTQWIAEEVGQHPPNTMMGTDSVLLGLNESSGYFFLDQPQGGWPVGTYRIDLFVGEEVSAYSYVADVRFRILDMSTKGRKPVKELKK